MKEEKFFLFRGDVWFVHPDARCTKILYSSVEEFIGDLCANPEHMSTLFDQQQYLINVLSPKKCSIVEQLKVDPDVIEVSMSSTNM